MNSWSGKLATASDPYFQFPPGTSTSTSHISQPITPRSETSPLNTPPPPPDASFPHKGSVESPQVIDSAPNTPVSITASIALETEDYFDLLEAVNEDRTKDDPDSLKRDLEINERVNQSLAEAEEAVLVREILSPRTAVTERKTVHLVTPKIPISTAMEEKIESESKESGMRKIVYVWNNFRDFATVRSITGFEEYIPQPRCLRNIKEGMAVEAASVVEIRDVQQPEDPNEGKGNIVEQKFEGNVVPEGPKFEPPPLKRECTITTEHASLPAFESSMPVETSASPLPTVPTLAQETVLPAETTSLTSDAPAKDSEASKQTWHSISTLLPTVKPPLVSGTSIPPPKEKQQMPAPPNLALKKPSQIAQIRVATSMKAEVLRPRGKLSPVNVLKDVEPADVENTWDMPATPLVEVDMERNNEDRRRNAGNDLFLLGLTASKKVEKPEGKKVAVIKETERIEIIPDVKTILPKIDRIFTPVENPGLETTVPRGIANVKLPINSPPATSGIRTSPVVRQPVHAARVGPSIQSPLPFVASAQRSGMPMPIPIPPTPRPATKSPVKSPVKPAIVPKPVNFVDRPQAKPTPSFLLDDSVDPFLAALQPTTKKDEFPSRPKTPSASTDSAESTPKKCDSQNAVPEKGLAIDNSSSAPLIESTSPSPTSLSSSWTLVGMTKKETETKIVSSHTAASSMSAISPSNRLLFGADIKTPASSTMGTPSATPTLNPVNPKPGQIPSESILAKSTTTAQSKKLFTFELKLGQSIISTPVHELDDPRFVAEHFVRKHDLETRLPGGKGTVERLVEYFEQQFDERKREREKRRTERRERLKAGLSERP